MNVDIINKLQFYGYIVDNKGLVYKHSHSTRRKEVAGQINDAGVYFYAQNVVPFKPRQNTIKDILGNDYKFNSENYKPFVPEKNIEHNFTFNDYYQNTQSKNQFSIYLKRFHKETLSKELSTNIYDIRGVKGGYFNEATLFPYINFHNEFLTAKIVKYNSNTGKRLKENYSNSWFHSEKTIKKSLGIKDKISKSVDCFFGEHLIAFNDKPIVIVEAEKTAVLLSLVFTNTVFIASGGLAKLKGLDWSFLANRQVFLYPDNNASEWFEIANNRGWFVSNILENEAQKGEDVADYLTNYKTDPLRAKTWSKLYEEIWCIDNRELTVKDNKTYSLGFENKKKLSFNYCLPIENELNLNKYLDTAKGLSFKGKHFQLFENDFKVLNANIDFNKTYKTEFGWKQMDADTFIVKLEKCFRIIKHLNPEKDYLKLFSKVLLNILLNSNHTFNISYIERVLIPFWNNDNNEIEKYYKFRNWRFSSTEAIEKKEFIKLLNNDKKIFLINQYLKKLRPLLSKKEFILPEYIGLHHKKGNEYVWNIIQKYNTKVLGCSNIRLYNNVLKITEYLNWWANNINNIAGKNLLYIELDSIYYSSNMNCLKLGTTFKFPSDLVISENTGVHRKYIKEYFKFKQSKTVLNELISEVDDYILNAQNFTFERVNGRLVATPEPIKENDIQINNNKQHLLSTEEAFNYDLDLTNSVLNISEADAIQQNTHFLTSWIYFHNPNLTEEEKEEIRRCPMLFFSPLNNRYLHTA
jgi:hypothetical protein